MFHISPGALIFNSIMTANIEFGHAEWFILHTPAWNI